VICFEGGYHGRALLTLSLTSKYGLFQSGFGPFAPEIVRLPIPHTYRTPKGMTADEYIDFGIQQIGTRTRRSGGSVGCGRDSD
jgi:4-aminobutyrate aminotransferase / (S)-3-amino-2-methylpropionate transaminase / 5-aminovalerate transaminase